MTAQPNRPYAEIHALLMPLGGQMTWYPGGEGGGGVWHLQLWGRTTKVEIRDNHPNDLDKLYDAKIQDPKTWDDFGTLSQDAVWKLVALFPPSV